MSRYIVNLLNIYIIIGDKTPQWGENLYSYVLYFVQGISVFQYNLFFLLWLWFKFSVNSMKL